MKAFFLAGLGLLTLTGCGPVPVDVAMKQCVEPAQLAQRPRGSVGITADNHGNVGTSLTIGVSTDYLQGRDPNVVFANCVRARSGQEPYYPFSSMPESRL
jgi:hypothetical protein